MQPITRWSFSDFDLDVRAGALRRGGQPVRINPQALKALTLLVVRQGELVTRQELRQAIWGDRAHGDFEHGLNVCIRQVRAALGESADGTALVVTCPREGYRMGVPVTGMPDAEPHVERQRWHWARLKWAAAACVLAAGLAALSWNRDTSAPPAGTASRASGAAEAVTASGPVFFARPGSTRRAEAEMWYWRGRAFYDRSTGRQPFGALPYFERAVGFDPTFAPAQAALAVTYVDRAVQGVESAASDGKARQASERARVLGPTTAETHVALAEVSYRLNDDARAAEQEFLRAIALDGRSAYVRQRYAVFLQEQRRFDAAVAQLRIAQEIDPLSVGASWQIADMLFSAGRFEESLTHAYETLKIDPSHSGTFRTIGQDLEAMGRHEEALDAYVKAGSPALGHLGRSYALLGRRDEAHQVINSIIRQTPDPGRAGVSIAYVHTGLGDAAAAMDWLARAHKAGRRLPFNIRVAPQWEVLRQSAAFDRFVKEHTIAGM